MKNKLILVFTFFSLLSCTKDIDIDEIIEDITKNYLTKVDVQSVGLPLNYNWHNFVTSSQNLVYLDSDDTPDIIGWYRKSIGSIEYPVFTISDYSGKMHYRFDMKEYNPMARDSLNNIFYDYDDINKDGNVDIFLLYNGEIGNPAKVDPVFTGTMSCVLLSKGKFEYDVIVLEDTPDENIFDNFIVDIDFDGYKDLVYPHSEYYFKNINGNSFERKPFPMNKSLNGITQRIDWDGDGNLDFISLDPSNRKELSIVTQNERIDIPFDDVGYEFVNQWANPTKWDPVSILFIDMDNDSYKDLIISGFYIDDNGSRVVSHKYFNNNLNQFNYIENKFENDSSINPRQKTLWVSDIDGDGDDDLYYPLINYEGNDYEDNSIYWFENDEKYFKINKNFQIKAW